MKIPIILILVFSVLQLSLITQNDETKKSAKNLTGEWIGTFDQNYGAGDDPLFKFFFYDQGIFIKGTPTHSFTLTLTQKDSSVLGKHYIELMTNKNSNVKFAITGKFQKNILEYKSLSKEFVNGQYGYCEVFNTSLTYTVKNGEEYLEGVWTGTNHGRICPSAWISLKRVKKNE